VNFGERIGPALYGAAGQSGLVGPANGESCLAIVFNCAGMTRVTAPLGTILPIIADNRQSTRAGIV
jgi:hypothetical protein